MRISIRPYRPEDAQAMVEAYRDSLRSIGLDTLAAKPDPELLDRLNYANIMFVAEIRGSGEIIGISGIASRLKHRIIGSAYLASIYVKKDYQRGKQGVNVGTRLREAAISKAKELGFRKTYGYSLSQSIGFNGRIGRFYPEYDQTVDGLRVHYHEIELRAHPFNALRLEPHVSELSLLGRIAGRLR